MLKRVRSPTRPTPPSRAIKEAALVRGCVKSTHSTISSESRCQAHSQIRGSRWLCVCSPGGCVSGGRRSPVPVLISACGAWAAHPTRLRLLVGLCTMAEPYSAAFAGWRRWLHCALNRRTGSRVAAWTDRASFSVESFGVANGFLRLTCCRVINLVLGVTRSSSRSQYNHAALLGADFEKHVLRLQAQL